MLHLHDQRTIWTPIHPAKPETTKLIQDRETAILPHQRCGTFQAAIRRPVIENRHNFSRICARIDDALSARHIEVRQVEVDAQ